MFDIMIIDHNQGFCEQLKNLINWKDINCNITAVVFGIPEAQMLFGKHHYDIVFLKVSDDMEAMCSFIQTIQVQFPSTLLIAVGDSEQYVAVRGYMKAGAYDYILNKQIQAPMLLELMEEAKKAYLAHHEIMRLQEESLRDKLREYLILRKNGHEVTMEQFNEVLSKTRYGYHNHPYHLVYFHINNINVIYQDRITDHGILRQQLHEVIDEIIPVSLQHTAIFLSNHSGLLILDSENKQQVIHCCEAMIHQVQEGLDLDISISLSKCSSSRLEFFALFEKLLKLHELRFYVDNTILVETENVQAFHDLDMNKINYHLEIVNKISERDFIAVLRILREALDYMRTYDITPEAVKDYFIFILNNVEGNEIMRGSRNVCAYDELKHNIKECESIHLLSDMVRDCFIQIELWLKDKQSIKYRQNISDIIDYINENYRSKLTLKMIADYFDINESYLSRMFKNETGKNLIYFINELKMKKAIELLSDPGVMIKEASSLVGMDDQFYFNKVFKKFYGVSPSEFRKKLHA